MKNFIRVLATQRDEKQSFENICGLPWLTSTQGYTLVFKTGELAGQCLFNSVPASFYFPYIDAVIKKCFQKKVNSQLFMIN